MICKDFASSDAGLATVDGIMVVEGIPGIQHHLREFHKLVLGYRLDRSFPASENVPELGPGGSNDVTQLSKGRVGEELRTAIERGRPGMLETVPID